MNIGIIIGRIGGIDGVALETEKWIKILKKLGHQIFIMTGKHEAELDEHITVVPEFDFNHPIALREQDHAFFKQNVKEESFIERLYSEAYKLENHLIKWIINHKIECILSENANALPAHLAMGIAIQEVLKKTELPCISHDHDFYWERGDRYKSKYKEVRKIIKNCFPSQLPNVKHAVINSYSHNELKKRFHLDSVIVPNVMDFNQSFAKEDNYNQKIHHVLGCDQNDILLFQITRIVRRKGIETAINLINEIDNPKVKLVITGDATDDKNEKYYCELVDQVEDYHLNERVIFAGQHFHTYRKTRLGELKFFSLEDAYVAARACTYFSTYEGFGNAFVEAILAKRPIFVNNYKPVFTQDIAPKGFKTVTIENSLLTAKNVENIKEIIYDPKLCKEISEYNFKLGKKYFSFEVLEHLLADLFSRLG